MWTYINNDCEHLCELIMNANTDVNISNANIYMDI